MKTSGDKATELLPVLPEGTEIEDGDPLKKDSSLRSESMPRTKEDLLDLMADIESVRRTEPKTVMKILSRLQKAALSIKAISDSKIERQLRELAATPITVFCTQKKDLETMKKMSREICKKWAQRRKQEEQLQDILSGAFKKAPTTLDSKTSVSDTL
jgi:vacuolar-type H+-ATPase subunit I/STV1